MLFLPGGKMLLLTPDVALFLLGSSSWSLDYSTPQVSPEHSNRSSGEVFGSTGLQICSGLSQLQENSADKVPGTVKTIAFQENLFTIYYKVECNSESQDMTPCILDMFLTSERKSYSIILRYLRGNMELESNHFALFSS